MMRSTYYDYCSFPKKCGSLAATAIAITTLTYAAATTINIILIVNFHFLSPNECAGCVFSFFSSLQACKDAL